MRVKDIGGRHPAQASGCAGLSKGSVKEFAMKTWKGAVIAEGLDDPATINKLEIYKASISRDGIPIDCGGHLGRWHSYNVRCSKKEIDELQAHILKGWYAHFWQRDRILVVFNDRQFELKRSDKSAWTEAVKHGLEQGIPENELDFDTD
jgi:hypothetical protein